MGLGTLISSVLALVLSLVLVLGLAWGAIFLLRRWQDRSLNAGGSGDGTAVDSRRLRFVRALPLGPRERVVLIEIGEETMLLGIGAAGVTLLSRWDAANGTMPMSAASLPPRAAPPGPHW